MIVIYANHEIHIIFRSPTKKMSRFTYTAEEPRLSLEEQEEQEERIIHRTFNEGHKTLTNRHNRALEGVVKTASDSLALMGVHVQESILRQIATTPLGLKYRTSGSESSESASSSVHTEEEIAVYRKLAQDSKDLNAAYTTESKSLVDAKTAALSALRKKQGIYIDEEAELAVTENVRRNIEAGFVYRSLGEVFAELDVDADHGATATATAAAFADAGAAADDDADVDTDAESATYTPRGCLVCD